MMERVAMTRHAFATPLTRAGLARAAGCNVETVRHYESVGLMPPPPRGANNCRLYDARHVARLRFILRARALGFDTAGVRELLALGEGNARDPVSSPIVEGRLRFGLCLTALVSAAANVSRGHACKRAHVRIPQASRSCGKTIVIAVADDGPGLPAKVREALFIPFTSARRGGTGLGLAIARDVMRTHGGDIALERTGPEGTVFRLTLPGESPMEPAPVEAAAAPP
jgi:signal transduction histidine kinase